MKRVLNNPVEPSEDGVEEPKRRRRLDPIPAGAEGNRPLVAIVGRPNVGKSTLFNRLARRRLAIVENIEGVTRDRHYADTNILGREVVLIDTGGFDPESDDPMRESIARQVKLALAECDVVICVLDGQAPPTNADREAVHLLRQAKKPVIFVANKSDTPRGAHESFDLYKLGIPSLLPVSSLHGHGLGALEESVARSLPKNEASSSPSLVDVPRIAIVGKPNAGKSSLVNRLLGEDRQIVDDRPGTTVDSIDTLMERDGEKYVVIDTAGMRRKRSVHETVESMSVLQAVRAMERSDLILLMIDAKEGVAEQDAKIAGLANDRGRAMVIVLNKMDLLKGPERDKAEEKMRDVVSFAPWAPVVHISAKTGRGINELFVTIKKVIASHRLRVTTGELNRFFEEVLAHKPPPLNKGKPVRLYYVTQAQITPPTFVAVSNFPDAVHFSYQRYVVNSIRERFKLVGTPIRVRYKAKRKKEL